MASSVSPSAEDGISPRRAAQFVDDPLWDASWVESAGEATIRKRQTTRPGRSPEFTLYASWFCPFAQRAWIAAEESGASYEWIEINPYEVNYDEPGGYTKKALSLEEKRKIFPSFMEASPRGLVPAIRHGDKVIWESLPVTEYIDSCFGRSTLVPRSDPYQTARVQIWSAHCTERVQKAYYGALMAQESAERQDYLTTCHRECRALANAMSKVEEGPYFLGNDFSLVDVAFVPFWQRMLWVGGHYVGLTFPDEPEFLRLHEWWDAVSSRPSVAATLVCKERLVASYSDYAKNAGTSDFALTFRK